MQLLFLITVQVLMPKLFSVAQTLQHPMAELNERNGEVKSSNEFHYSCNAQQSCRLCDCHGRHRSTFEIDFLLFLELRDQSSTVTIPNHVYCLSSPYCCMKMTRPQEYPPVSNRETSS